MTMLLTARQQAMLKEMGIPWLPGTAFAPMVQPAVAQPASSGANTALAAPAPRTFAQSRPSQPATQTPTSITAPSSAPSTTRPAMVRVSQAPAHSPATTGQAAPPLADMPSLADLDWAALQQTAAECRVCGLCQSRKNSTLAPVVGQADWMVVGEPPDEEEDASASPFAGQSGVLLGNMLKALGLQRLGSGAVGRAAGSPPDAPHTAATMAYVTNVVKCRPPHARIPSAQELHQCSAYLQREIALVQPKMILAMGRFAIQLLLSETPERSTQPLGKQRGTVHRYQGIPVVVTYHPNALLRNSADKGKAWADLCLAAQTLEFSASSESSA